MNLAHSKDELNQNGFTIISSVYTQEEVGVMLKLIEATEPEKENFRKSSELFAIRQFLKEVPALRSYIFNNNFSNLLNTLAGTNYLLVKSIYFDKPGSSNWYVSYHQDLTISVLHKKDTVGFNAWTIKNNQYAVQPPLDILENIVTMRIHLDDTDENNGALKIIPGSHLKGIYRPEHIDWESEKETVCKVKAGGVMLMKPLLLHSSSRTTNNQKRRVMHLEFSDEALPGELKWAELL